jgi:PhnB protein
MPTPIPYLVFDGNCAEAMRFYEQALGGQLHMMTHGQSPAAVYTPPGNADRVLHARLVLDGGFVMASDALAGQPYEGMKGFSVSLVFPSGAEARRVWDTLSDRARTVIMPLQQTFWAEAFGMLVDRFGTPWMINGGMTGPVTGGSPGARADERRAGPARRARRSPA